MKQEHTSDKTSINTVTKLYNSVFFPPGTEILDYGGGKYDTNTNLLKSRGVVCKVYDPYNRSLEHNTDVLVYFTNGADVIVCANVLNVIKEDTVITNVLKHIDQLLKSNGTAYIQIYEGDKTGEGKKTSKGFQRNQKTICYLPLITSVFSNVTRKGNIFTIKKE